MSRLSDTIVSTTGVDDENNCSHDTMSDITSTSIKQAAMKLHHANYLLITTGAGFSADSGLQTYECAPVEYRVQTNRGSIQLSTILVKLYTIILKY